MTAAYFSVTDRSALFPLPPAVPLHPAHSMDAPRRGVRGGAAPPGIKVSSAVSHCPCLPAPVFDLIIAAAASAVQYRKWISSYQQNLYILYTMNGYPPPPRRCGAGVRSVFVRTERSGSGSLRGPRDMWPRNLSHKKEKAVKSFDLAAQFAGKSSLKFSEAKIVEKTAPRAFRNAVDAQRRHLARS